MTQSPSPLIHIGYPKTASTWLQRVLFQPDFGFHKAMTHVEIQLGIAAPTPFCYSPERVRELYERNLADRGQSTPVVSSEILAGNIYCGGYNARQNADRLYATFPDARVLIVIREQKSFIRALYKTLIEWGMPFSIDRLLAPHEPTRFPQFNFDWIDYNLISSYYIELFGADRVLVIPFELLATNQQQFVRDILEFTGSTMNANTITVKPGKTARVNESIPLSSIIVQRWFNSVFISNAVNYSGLFPATRHDKIYRIRRLLRFIRLPAAVNRTLEKSFSDKVISATSGRFGAGNNRLQQLCRYDLRQFNYDFG